MRSPAPALLAICVLAGACSPDLKYPSSGVQYTCRETNRCPNAMTCNPASHLCEIAGGRARVLGQNCQDASDCSSGNCTDGVCCDTACSGICERCDIAGNLGTCAPTLAGQDPDHECEKAGQHQNCALRDQRQLPAGQRRCQQHDHRLVQDVER